MENKFKKVMQQHNDATLMNIITKNKKDYTKDALEAAKQELLDRGVDLSDLNLDSQNKENNHQKSNENIPQKEKSEWVKQREEKAKFKLYIAALAGPVFIYMGCESHSSAHTTIGWILIVVFWPLLYWHYKKNQKK